MRKRLFRGFTLIELLVVIAIIGILASIVTVSLQSARAKGRDAKRISDVRSIQLALETYYNDNGHYPCDIYSNPASPAACLPGFSGTYMSSVPYDPNDAGPPTHTVPYIYTAMYTSTASVCNFYHLGAAMEDTTNAGLKQDNDLAYATYSACTANAGHAKFDGNGAACTATSASSPDPCYDVTP